MALVNEHFLKLSNSYLFSDIAKKVHAFNVVYPKAKLIRLGIGDVTRPLPPACIEAMHRAVDELADASTFHGYGPEQGYGSSSISKQQLLRLNFPQTPPSCARNLLPFTSKH